MSLRPPQSPLFPYTTLFRSRDHGAWRQNRCSALLGIGDGCLFLPSSRSVAKCKRANGTGRNGHLLPFGTDRHERIHFVTFARSEEHTSELQSQFHLVCRLLL